KIVVISSVKRQHHYEGKTLGEIARLRGQDLYDAMLDLLVEEETAVAAIAHVMSEADVQRVMAHPTTMIGTDGFPQREGKPHPRTFGTYPRVLAHYVRTLGVLTLEQAVHKMTGMVAAKLGLNDRGVIRPGAKADLVLFDPERVEDRSSYADPRRSPAGIAHVFVNGAWTVRDGKHTGARAGRVLARPRRCDSCSHPAWAGTKWIRWPFERDGGSRPSSRSAKGVPGSSSSWARPAPSSSRAWRTIASTRATW